MRKVAIVYWSGTGNTEAMANAVLDGAKATGVDVTLCQVSDFSADKVSEYDAIAFGCPAMGAEALEDSEFEPVFDACLPLLGDKKIALFGSYDWGDGEWLRLWEETCNAAGITLASESVKCNNAPDAAGLNACIELGKKLALQ